MRRKSWVLIGVVAAVLVACSSNTTSPPTSSAAGSSPSWSSSSARASGSTDLPAGHVRVTVTGLTGAEGGTLVGIVFDGPTAKDGVGGFVVRVTSDPFATTQTVTAPETLTEPGQVKEGLFPYVTSTPLVLADGNYRLQFWAAPDGVESYARWVAAESPGMLTCRAYFEVAQPRGTALSIADVPPSAGERPEDQACTLP